MTNFKGLLESSDASQEVRDMKQAVRDMKQAVNKSQKVKDEITSLIFKIDQKWNAKQKTAGKKEITKLTTQMEALVKELEKTLKSI